MKPLVLSLILPLLAAGATAEPDRTWPSNGTVTTFPADISSARAGVPDGWNAAALKDAKAIFDGQDSAALVVLHKGELVASWGSVTKRYTAQSVRKGLLNSLVGTLWDAGKLDLDATLEELGINDTDPVLTDGERQATLRQLMQSRSGIFHSALYEVGGWKRLRADLAKEEAAAGHDKYPPGTYWIYNNWDFNAVGTIVEKISGQDIGPFFESAIARPIGMQDFRPEDVEYTTRDHGAERHFGNSSDHRAYVFNISTRDLARYGLLFLNRGEWDGTRILSEDWVRETLDTVDTKLYRPEGDTITGFGEFGLLWMADREGARRYQDIRTRDPFFYTTGNRGHVLLVFPALDLVIAHQVATEGGVSEAAQRRRATEGTPEVTHEQVQALVNAIIRAHPDASEAFLPPCRKDVRRTNADAG